MFVISIPSVGYTEEIVKITNAVTMALWSLKKLGMYELNRSL